MSTEYNACIWWYVAFWLFLEFNSSFPSLFTVGSSLIFHSCLPRLPPIAPSQQDGEDGLRCLFVSSPIRSLLPASLAGLSRFLHTLSQLQIHLKEATACELALHDGPIAACRLTTSPHDQQEYKQKERQREEEKGRCAQAQMSGKAGATHQTKTDPYSGVRAGQAPTRWPGRGGATMPYTAVFPHLRRTGSNAPASDGFPLSFHYPILPYTFALRYPISIDMLRVFFGQDSQIA